MKGSWSSDLDATDGRDMIGGSSCGRPRTPIKHIPIHESSQRSASWKEAQIRKEIHPVTKLRGMAGDEASVSGSCASRMS